MADQYQVNENTNQENPSLEEEAAAMDAAENTEATEQVESTDRPEWLDEKFQSPEDMAKAYKELQSKMSSGEEEEAEVVEEVPTSEGGANSVIMSATEEFNENGELSDDAFNKLSQAGIPKEMVEAYIKGQQAIGTGEVQTIQESVGGEEAYGAMSEWAGQTLTDAELNSYNSLVNSGNVDTAKMAVKGLYAQFQASGNASPSLQQGGTSGGGSVQGFNSSAQMVAAMQDPRYKDDPAYRANIEKRLSVSKGF